MTWSKVPFPKFAQLCLCNKSDKYSTWGKHYTVELGLEVELVEELINRTQPLIRIIHVTEGLD